MKHFKATKSIFETAANTRAFVKDNKDVFWAAFKPLIPYIFGLLLLDLIISFIIGRTFSFGSFAANYFFAALAITWHRVVLLGPDQYEAMNPFKPKKHELIFMLMGVGVALVVLAIVGLFIAVSAILGPVFLALSVFLGIFLSIFLSARFGFYFPAKAVNADLSLINAFHLSKGYVFNLLTAPFFACWRLILGMMGAIIVASIFMALLSQFAQGQAIFEFLIQLPILFYFQPLLTIIGITILSNYYQHALQNKAPSTTSEG